MSKVRLVLGAVLLALLLGTTSCASGRKQKMLDSAPIGYDVQLITLTVKDRQYGRLTVEQTIVDLLSRREGVLDVRRGAGREELYVLAEAFVDPYALPRTAPERFTVRVVSVEKPDAKPIP